LSKGKGKKKGDGREGSIFNHSPYIPTAHRGGGERGRGGQETKSRDLLALPSSGSWWRLPTFGKRKRREVGDAR